MSGVGATLDYILELTHADVQDSLDAYRIRGKQSLSGSRCEHVQSGCHCEHARMLSAKQVAWRHTEHKVQHA